MELIIQDVKAEDGQEDNFDKTMYSQTIKKEKKKDIKKEFQLVNASKIDVGHHSESMEHKKVVLNKSII